MAGTFHDREGDDEKQFPSNASVATVELKPYAGPFPAAPSINATDESSRHFFSPPIPQESKAP